MRGSACVKLGSATHGGPREPGAVRVTTSEVPTWPREIKLGVNLSPLQLRKPGFVLDVVSALNQAGLPAHRLDLEVTESALLASDIATRTALNELHDLGVRLSLDDFGTGYSSLQLLRTFPFDKIKIDMKRCSTHPRRARARCSRTAASPSTRPACASTRSSATCTPRAPRRCAGRCAATRRSRRVTASCSTRFDCSCATEERKD